MPNDHQAQLAERALPSPGGAVQRVLQLMGREATTTVEIAQALSGDPAMTGRVIRLANSALFGGRSPAVSLHDALQRIGINALRQVLISFSLVDRYRHGVCREFDYQAFWAQSLATGIVARHLAVLERLPVPTEVFTVGLLTRIGELALASLHPDDYGPLHQGLAGAAASRVVQTERSRFASDRFQLAERLLREWALPDTMSSAVHGSGDPAASGLLPQSMAMRLARLLHAAVGLGALFESSSPASAEALAEVRKRCAEARIPVSTLCELLPAINAEWREWAAMLELILHGSGPLTLEPPQPAEVIPFPGVTLLATPDDLGQSDATVAPGSGRAKGFVDAVRRMQGVRKEVRAAMVAEMPATLGRAEQAQFSPAIHAAAPAVQLENPADADFEPAAVVAQGKGLSVLLAHPDVLGREPLAALLQTQGHELVLVGTGDEALGAALRSPPQVLICDTTLRGMDAVSLFRALREHRPGNDIYILACGPREQQGALETAFGAGADDFLPTPVRAGELLGRLRGARRFLEVQARWRADHEEMRRMASALSTLNSRLEAAMDTDQLTGVANRKRATEKLAEAVARCEAMGQPLSLLLIDLDHFKETLDHWGRAVGDDVLRAAARTLRACIREDDLVARFGDQEFLVIAPGTTATAAAALAERLRVGVSRLRIQSGEEEISLTLSVGAAVYDPLASRRRRTPEGLLHVADEALYRAKETGRNRVCVAAERPAGH
jgi:diguanylate cyclase (GGDEF)-like protein